MRIDHLLDKGIGMMNEDAIVVTGGRFGVFDGASSVNSYVDEQGRTGGYLASNIAKATFKTSASGLVETSLEANRRIGAAMAAKNIDTAQKENTWCTTMAAVDVDIANREFEWAQIADSIILVINMDGTHQGLIRDDYDHDRELMLRWKEMADRRVDDIRSRLQSEIVELRRNANVKYGVLNGDPNAEKFLRTGSYLLEYVAHVLIFTDGMIPPKKDPTAADDFSPIVKLFLEGGLPRIRDWIREIENGDPNCWEFPRYKKSDDIAAIAVSFGADSRIRRRPQDHTGA